jgi:hypothetical protein
MEQSPSWEVTNHVPSQEILHLSRNPEVYYLVRNNAPLVPILSQMHPVQTLPSYISKIHSNIIFSSMPGKNFPFCFACYMPLPSHSPWFMHPTNILWSLEIMKIILQFSPASRHFPSLSFKYSTQLRVVKHSRSMFFPLCDRPSFTPISFKFLKKIWQKILNRLVASFPKI